MHSDYNSQKDPKNQTCKSKGTYFDGHQMAKDCLSKQPEQVTST